MTKNELMDRFPRNVTVHVTRKDDDLFSHDFTGNVISYTTDHVLVEDQDGDCWSCDDDQLTIVEVEG